MKIDCAALAAMAAARLESELSAEPCDTKRAKDLSSILKELCALDRELGKLEVQKMIVEFCGETESAAE